MIDNEEGYYNDDMNEFTGDDDDDDDNDDGYNYLDAEVDRVYNYNYGDAPVSGDVRSTSSNDSWNISFKDCLSSLRPPYNAFYSSSLIPSALTANTDSKRYRNVAALVLGFCTHIALIRQKKDNQTKDLKQVLYDVVTVHSELMDRYNARPPDVLREYTYFKLNAS